MSASLHRHGQLAVVIVGFFATLQILILGAGNGTVPPLRAAVTFAVMLACAVRYWWVIVLLAWPFHWVRVVLLLSAWSALPAIAMSASNARWWVFALAALAAIGAATEIFNRATDQWKVDSAALSTVLKRDHTLGALAALLAAVVFAAAGLVGSPAVIDRLVVVLVASDWIRLVVMIRSHQRLLITEPIG